MKSLFAICCLFALTATSYAGSQYAGSYFGLSSSQGQLVAGANITVRTDGSFSGKGAYTDLTEFSVSGTVDSAGKVAIKETDDDGSSYAYTANFNAKGKKFVAQLSTGNVFKGKKINANFPQAGIYHAETDLGEEGVFLLDRNGAVYGVVYDYYGDAIIVTGKATASGFSGESEDGVSFEGTFQGNNISGTYSDGTGFDGNFTGSKY